MKESGSGLKNGGETGLNNVVNLSKSWLGNGDEIIPNNAVKQSGRGLEKRWRNITEERREAKLGRNSRGLIEECWKNVSLISLSL